MESISGNLLVTIGSIKLVIGTAVVASAGAAAAETITYVYDAHGRLVQVQRTGAPQGTETAQYSYDQADNRTRVLTTSTNPNTPPPPPPPPPSTPAPSYYNPYSFETPALGASFAYRPAVDHVTFSGNSGLAGNGSSLGFTAAPSGTQIAFLHSVPNEGSSITLRFGDLSSGQNYRVRFRLAQRPGYSANPISVIYNGVALQNSASPGSATFWPSSVSFGEYFTYWFTAATDTVSIEFRTYPGTEGPASAVDYVSLQES